MVPGLLSTALRRAAGGSGSTTPPATLLEAQLGGGPAYHLHTLFESCGIELCPGDKKVSRVWRRLAGRTALEAAVTLGHAAPAAELLAAGAAVRPQAWAALTLYCPPAAHDQLAALLAASQASPAALLPHWPASYRAAVQALLCVARRGRSSGAAEEQASGAALLARLPHELLLRAAALAAAPRSAW
ncbi:transcriptional regulator [Micractinium conductrix]|uniref:Transcriptional regulator n=1 Tax=Micractinium conductrix TaxID=554055 RepID=A0A2P6VD50_9CHLO|nr:transcriptional regulator [Micractinium conductrix]|eukprot:PSC72007.1 transcriptional regulator [Micractinium conductrix]